MTPPYIQLTYAYHEGKPYLAVATVPLKAAEPAVRLKFTPGKVFESASHTWGSVPVSDADSADARMHLLRLLRDIEQ